MKIDWEEAKYRVHQLMRGHRTEQRVHLGQHRPYPMDDVVPRSYLIGSGVIMAVQPMIMWLDANKRRKTVARKDVEELIINILNAVPAELDRIVAEDYLKVEPVDDWTHLFYDEKGEPK